MKIRTCFVSNSSSSSCVCDICGRSETGMDLCPSQVDMFQCINGHTICNDEAVTDWEEAEKKAKKEAEEKGEEFDEFNFGYEAPEYCCPICSMLEFSQRDLKAFLKKEHGIPEKEVFDTVKAANKRRKKLYDSEYVMYVLSNKSLRMEEVVANIKNRFKTYREFRTYLQ